MISGKVNGRLCVSEKVIDEQEEADELLANEAEAHEMIRRLSNAQDGPGHSQLSFASPFSHSPCRDAFRD